MSKCLSIAQLQALARNGLSTGQRLLAEEHLKRCLECQRRYAQMQGDSPTQSRSSGMEPTITEEFVGELGDELNGRARDNVPGVPGYGRLEVIARGGQGEVFRAIQESTQRRVALKILFGAKPTSAQQMRFQREVEILASIAHPAIVTIYDSGVAAGLHYYSMEYIDGQSVIAHVRAARASAREVLVLFAEIAEAIGAAHARGIVHRDIKPSNILVDKAGRAHVLDFGLAKPANRNPAAQQVTNSGEFVGTLAYAAPEQRRTSDLDARADVYSLGVVLYEALTGRMPYELSGDLPRALMNIFDADAPAPSRAGADVDEDVNTIVLRALAQEPARRYATCGDLAEDLRSYLAGQVIRARRDSVTYVLRKSVIRQVVRNPVLFLAAGVIFSVAIGLVLLLTGFLVRPIDRWFENRIAAWDITPLTPAWSDSIAFIAMDDATYEDMPRLAGTLGLPAVKQADVQSWRVLHGRLMEQLAVAAPRVLAWDVRFGPPKPEFDGSFVTGMQKLRGAGTEVILAARSLTPAREPAISPPLREAADGWGWFWLFEHAATISSVVLAVDAPPLPTSPSLSLRTYAAFREPGTQPVIVWHLELNRMEVRYRKKNADSPNGDWVGHTDHVEVSYQDERNLQPFDFPYSSDTPRLAYLWISLPSSQVLARQTTAYKDVFACNADDLRARFKDRIVFVGDSRLRYSPEPDHKTFVAVGGPRKDFGFYAHAAAVNTLLAQSALAKPGFQLEIIVAIAAAAVGGFAGLVTARPLGRIHGAGVIIAITAALAALVVLLAILGRRVMSLATVLFIGWSVAYWFRKVMLTCRRHA
jgi:CHASE2 domain-containing sensor protein